MTEPRTAYFMRWQQFALVETPTTGSRAYDSYEEIERICRLRNRQWAREAYYSWPVLYEVDDKNRKVREIQEFRRESRVPRSRVRKRGKAVKSQETTP